MISLPFSEIWCVDFEFDAPPGERSKPACLCARELRSDRRLRLWRDELGQRPPYRIDNDALFVAYFASAELGCHRALGWPMPARVLDLYAEFRVATNGQPVIAGNGLLGALTAYKLSAIGTAAKDAMRGLILGGGPWSAEERKAILDYCESDVDALARLLPAMLPKIDLPRALLRGRYMAAVAAMEHYGVPIDVPTLTLLREHREIIRDELIVEVDKDFGVYTGQTFRQAKFAEWTARAGIDWPRLDGGRLALADDVFKHMSLKHPAVEPLRKLRGTLADLRLENLGVGSDGRNRCLLSPFSAKSGRNLPSNSKFIFGASAWMRGLIQPPPDYGVAYVDWSQQEFGIAAVLSSDPAMITAYQSGDPYLEFAKQAGAVPADATKQTHPRERELYKTCALGVQYGMEAGSLAVRTDQPPIVARDLLRAHHETYKRFWSWVGAAVDHGTLGGTLHTVYGWPIHFWHGVNPRMLMNFPMQANGAEMMRIAACLATERGVEVCAPVHDAFLIAAPLDRLETAIARMRKAMAESSAAVLGVVRAAHRCHGVSSS